MRRRRAESISTDDLKRAYDLFVDTKRSSEFLQEYQQQFLFNDESSSKDVTMTDAQPL